jgi:hypothetical protein
MKSLAVRGRAFDPLLDLAEIGQRHLFPVGVREITTQGEPTGLLPVEQQPRPTALSEHVALQLTDVVSQVCLKPLGFDDAHGHIRREAASLAWGESCHVE